MKNRNKEGASLAKDNAPVNKLRFSLRWIFSRSEKSRLAKKNRELDKLERSLRKLRKKSEKVISKHEPIVSHTNLSINAVKRQKEELLKHDNIPLKRVTRELNL